MDRLDAVVRELRTAAESAPSETSAEHSAPRPDRSRHLRPRIARRWSLLLIVPVLLVAVGFARSTEEPRPKAISPIVGTVDPWQAVLAAIDRRRMQAFINDDPAALLAAEVKDSSAYETDIAIMTDLRMRDIALDHNPLRVIAITEEFVTLSGEAQRARLRVTDVLDAYTLKNDAGEVVESHPARGPRTWRLDLERQRGRDWRLIRVMPVPAPQSPAPSTRP